MAIQSIINMNVDFYDKEYILINAKQYDDKSRWISVTCYNQGELLGLNSNEHTAYVRYKKADGYGVLNTCRIDSKGRILVELTEQMLAAVGVCYVDLIIVNKGKAIINIDTGEIITVDSSPIISTMAFCINVYESAVDNSLIESSYEFNVLNEKLQKIDADYTEVIQLAKSYAVGDANNIRENENYDNSKYWSEQAHDSANSANASESKALASEQAALASENACKDYASQSAASATASANSASESATSASNSAASATEAKNSMNSASASATAASNSETNANASAESASNSAASATRSAEVATEKERSVLTTAADVNNKADTVSNLAEIASNSATSASASATSASESATSASNSATSASTSENNSKSYAATAKSSMDSAVNSATSATNSASEAYGYYLQLEEITSNLNGAFIPRGTVAFSELATLLANGEVEAGYLYNISNDFTTDATFKKGAGTLCAAGTNVYRTSDGYWDCLVGTTVPSVIVNGVKGNNEIEYRQGYVNITPENIGSIPSSNIASVDEIKTYLGI